MKNEKRAYPRLKASHPDAHWQRIEGYTSTGAFDINACVHGREVWIESKDGTVPKHANGLVRCKVRPSQVAWEHLRRQAGGRTFLAILVGDRLFIIRGQYIAVVKKGVTIPWLVTHDVGVESIFAL